MGRRHWNAADPKGKVQQGNIPMSGVSVHVSRYADRKNLVLWWRDPVSDKIKTKSAGTHRESEAERAAERLERKLESYSIADDRITWARFRERVEDEKLPPLASNTRDAYASAMNSLENLCDPRRLSALARPQAWTTYAERLRKTGVSDATIAAYLRAHKAILRWAKTVGLIAEVPPLPKIRLGHRNAVMRGRPITGEELDRIVAAVEGMGWPADHIPPWQRYLRGLWWSGLRLGESLAVSWDQDAEFCIDLSGQKPRYRIYSEAQKGRRDELLPIAPEFAAMLEAWPGERAGPVFQMINPATGRPFPNYKGAGELVGEIGKRAGVKVANEPTKYATAQNYRQAFGTRWAKLVRPNVLQKMMRHKSYRTTQDFYVHEAADDLANEIYTAFNNSLNISQSDDVNEAIR